MLPFFWNQLAEAWVDRHSKKDEQLQNEYHWNEFIKNGTLLDGIQLSPEQLAVVQTQEKHLLISGSAGSGKSITLLGRMFKVLAEPAPSRILYVSFNPTLMQDANKRCMQSPIFRELKDVHTVHFYTYHFMVSRLLKESGLIEVGELQMSTHNLDKLDDLAQRRCKGFTEKYVKTPEYSCLPRDRSLYTSHFDGFMLEEFLWMKANGYVTEELYLDCERAGRGINPRLTKEQRYTVFQMFTAYHRYREQTYGKNYDPEDYALILLRHIEMLPDALKYDHIFIDEFQDLQPMQLKSLVLLAKKSLALSGDLKQRIYKRTPFAFKDLGIEVEGRRTHRLKINYRSTKQTMKLARSISFLDTENDREDDLLFVREGPKPEIRYYQTTDNLNRYLIREIHALRQQREDCSIAVIHRYDGDMWKTKNCKTHMLLKREFDVVGVESYGKKFNYSQQRKPVFFTDAFAVKGLEFDFVFILHFDSSHYPQKSKIDDLLRRSENDKWSNNFISDEDAIYNDEKKILYVALSRAKEKVVLLYKGETERKISPFVRLFHGPDYAAHGFTKSRYTK